MARRELLQLAHTFNTQRHNVAGWYISEKLDGCRALWDGGISRGVPTVKVPWAATTDPKTGQRKAKVKEIATGLWSRYGNPIMAPDWFLDSLPHCPLDGELWAGRGNFQTCRSIISRDVPDERWGDIAFRVYGSPPLNMLFRDGEIKNSNMHETISQETCFEFVADQIASRTNPVSGKAPIFEHLTGPVSFEQELSFLNSFVWRMPFAEVHMQHKLPSDEELARHDLDTLLSRVLDLGGEGVMLRDPMSVWTPKRVRTLLKYKPFLDDEATIIGFVAGREGKQGNLLGRIGTLIVKWKGVEFEIGTGMTTAEREIEKPWAIQFAATHAGERLPDAIQGRHFKIGDRITFKFRELSDAGVPKEARFWRSA